MTQLRFTHIGMNHVVCANRVLAVVVPQTKSSQRYAKSAKDVNRFIDATLGRTIKSLLLLDDGTVIASAIKPKTLMRRLSGDDIQDDMPDDVQDDIQDDTQDNVPDEVQDDVQNEEENQDEDH